MGRGIVIQIEVDEHGSVQGVQRIARELNTLDGAGRRASGGVSSAEKSLSRLNAIIASGGLAYALERSSRAMLGIGKSTAEMAGSYETLRVGLDTVTKGRGAETLDRLANWARVMPGTTKEATQSFITMYAMGLKPAIKDMTTLMDATSALGGGMDRFAGISLALGQIATKNELMAQEVRQLAERGIPVYEILNEKLGITGKQLEAANHKAISAKEAIRAIFEGMDERYGGQSARMAIMLEGRLSTLHDDLQLLQNDMMSGGALDVLKEGIRELDDELVRLKESGELREFAREAAEAVVGLSRALLKISEWTIEHKDGIKIAFESAAIFLAFQRIALLIEGLNALATTMKALGGVAAFRALFGMNPYIAGGTLAVGGTAAAAYSAYKLTQELDRTKNPQDQDIRASIYRSLPSGHPASERYTYGTAAGVSKAQYSFSGYDFLRGTILDAMASSKAFPEKLYASPDWQSNYGTSSDFDSTDKAKKAAEQLLAIQQKYADWKVSVMDDGLAKEFATMNNWYDKEKTEAAGNSKALAVLAQQKTDWQAQIVSDWQSKMEKEQKEYNEEDKKRAQKQAEDIAQIMSESNALQISMIQDPRARAFAEIDQWLSEYKRDHQGNATAISIGEQFAKDKKAVYDFNEDVERAKKLAEEAQQRWLDFGNTIENVLYGALTASGNVFENIASAFGDMLDRMLAEMAARAAAFAVLNIITGGAASAKTGKSFLDVILSGFASGGYTGYGDRREVAGLVHRNEYVIPARTVDAYGTGFFDNIVSGRIGNTSTSNSTTANFYITSNGTTTRVKGGNSAEMKTVLKQVFRDNPDLRRELLGRA